MKAKLTYFRDTGKWYADAEVEIPDDTPHWMIKSHILDMNPMPGLMGQWKGYILVDMDLPILILTEGQR